MIKSDQYPPPCVIQPTARHTHTAILLHGLGSNGRDLGSFLLRGGSTHKDSPGSQQLNARYPSMKWVFPTASCRPSSRLDGVGLVSWFDLFSIQDLSYKEETQAEGLAQSSHYLRDILEDESRAFKGSGLRDDEIRKRIVLGGLSQGCAMSLMALVSLDHGLGGWVGMSGFFPAKGLFEKTFGSEDRADGTTQNPDDQLTSEIPALRALNTFRQDVLKVSALEPQQFSEIISTPCFYGHGSSDDRISCQDGDILVELLRELDMDVEHRVYQGLGHWIRKPEEVDDFIAVLQRNGSWPDPNG
jgi:predicted esterase